MPRPLCNAIDTILIKAYREYSPNSTMSVPLYFVEKLFVEALHSKEIERNILNHIIKGLEKEQ